MLLSCFVYAKQFSNPFNVGRVLESFLFTLCPEFCDDLQFGVSLTEVFATRWTESEVNLN